MKGELYINNKDAWETWSIRLQDSPYSSLLLSPKTKPYIQNKNRSEHGTRVHVSNSRLDERTFQVVFGITCESEDEFLLKYDSFIEELNKGWIYLKVSRLKKAYKLLIDDYLDLSTGISLRSGKLSVRFNEPNPDDRDRIIEVLGTTRSRVLLTIDNQAIKK